jgi:alkylation response protein AidB-like acyl-CoA dehydrogenase
MPADLEALTRAVAAGSVEGDVYGCFPDAAFAALNALGLLRDPPWQTPRTGELLRLLAAIGRGDMSAGRIYEGHVNALILVDQFGGADAILRTRRLLAEGGVFGVWNTDVPDQPLGISRNVLSGKKNFASGADKLTHAIVTTGTVNERRMFLVPTTGLPVDRSWWKPLGMRASGSHVIDFDDVVVEDDWEIGAPGDYTLQPWISAGAVRFVAVQVGGMHAVLEITIDHLNRTSRSEDRIQRQRLATMATAVETGYLWLDRVAHDWQTRAADDILSASSSAARGSVEAGAMLVLDLAEKAIGAAGMIAPHPLERVMRDLRTYLRQPNPDGAVDHFGESVAAGIWTAGARPIGDV